ncbi:NAD-dependent epimerase/dehydratase family protein [Micrococcales bacterium 31B]|nr:NAD-dependent epimerase/dehydratase family protein [Micrococcales bacterium 31B]
MKILVTGARGFLGWHTRLRAHALHPDLDIVGVGREDVADLPRLADGVDVVIHIAGVNRAESDEAVERGNIDLADALVAALPPTVRRIVFANSIQAELDNPYGRGKAAAATALREWAESHGARFSDVLLPNLFGEHGKPDYNSFVATFAHRIAHGEPVTVTGDREVALLHVQDAAEVLLSEAVREGADVTTIRPPGHPIGISALAQMLQNFYDAYRTATLPALATRFETHVFNTLRAAMFPAQAPFTLTPHSDARGTFFECARVLGGEGQTSFSTTVPGIRRGDHYHLRKIERFIVIAGTGIIRLRRMLTDEVVEFRVSGSEPVAVDMPTGWSHSVENTGNDDMLTMFWINEIYNPDDPDTFFEAVTDAPVQRTNA